MLDMYKGMVNSPETTITNDINAEDTIIYVLDETKVPEELPNLMTLGTGTSAETVKVLEVNGNALTVERGFQGVPRSWNAGTVIARNFTEYDYNALKENIETLDKEMGNLDSLSTEEKSNLVGAINEVCDDLVAHKADYEQHTPYAIATGTNTYTATIQGITTLVEGMSIKVKFQNANTGTATLNINGLGAKAIKKSNGNDLASGNIKAGQILHLVYTGSVFQLLGEGGEYGNVTPDDVIKGVTFGTEEGLKTGTLELTGNATTADVLSGKTFYNTNPKSKLTGSMPNRGAVNQTLTTQGGSYTIPAGYHNGSGIVKAQFANLVAENIKSGVNIGGVVGTLVEPIVVIQSQDIAANSTATLSLGTSLNPWRSFFCSIEGINIDNGLNFRLSTSAGILSNYLASDKTGYRGAIVLQNPSRLNQPYNFRTITYIINISEQAGWTTYAGTNLESHYGKPITLTIQNNSSYNRTVYIIFAMA